MKLYGVNSWYWAISSFHLNNCFSSYNRPFLTLIVINSSRKWYEIQILQFENRAAALEKQQRVSTEKQAKIVAELKHKIAAIQQKIDERSGLMATLE